MKRWLAATVALAGGLAAAACQDPGSQLCDPGQILDPVSGYCIAGPVDAGRAGDAASRDAGTAPDAACSAGSSSFGDTCSGDADCHCPTDYCAILPGSTSGTCTRTGCDANPSICPASWTCLDLSQFQAGLPHICYQP